MTGINKTKVYFQKDISFQNLRVVCDRTDDLNGSTQSYFTSPVPNPTNPRTGLHVSKRTPKPKTYSSSGGYHPSWNANFVMIVCGSQTLVLASTAEREQKLLKLMSSSIPTRSFPSFDKPPCGNNKYLPEDADKQWEPKCLMHNIPYPSVIALSRTPISVTCGEGRSVSMTRKTADAWFPLQEPARGQIKSRLLV